MAHNGPSNSIQRYLNLSNDEFELFTKVYAVVKLSASPQVEGSNYFHLEPTLQSKYIVFTNLKRQEERQNEDSQASCYFLHRRF